MLTLYHAPNSRSDMIVRLVQQLGAADQVRVQQVNIPRQDGSGARDPANPHPEGKVPYLTNGHDHVRERGAITLYLTDMFPDAGLGRGPDDPQRGAYLSWLFWYQGVFEPVLILNWTGLSHPAVMASWRDYDTAMARLEDSLRDGPFLLGDRISAADLLIASPFAWFDMSAPARVADWAAGVNGWQGEG